MDPGQQRDREDNQNGSSGRFMALTFAAGGLLGAAFGVLLTPWKGSQTRNKIKEVAGDLKEKTNGWQWLKKEKGPVEKGTGTAGIETISEGRGNPGEGEPVHSNEGMSGGVPGL